MTESRFHVEYLGTIRKNYVAGESLFDTAILTGTYDCCSLKIPKTCARYVN